uniref:RUN and TBC1 domain-containing protein 3 n=1 Tax=Steinernema glaseri TaxID=37863 RepID=A0A1I7ZVY2_9BILA
MCSLIEDVLPPNYYSHSLLGLQADDKVTRHLLRVHIPDIDQKLTENDVELSLISVNWLLTLFSAAFPMPVLLRVWDMLFVFGGVTMFRVILSMLKLREQDVLDVATVEGSSAELFNVLSQIPSQLTRIDHLVEMMTTFEFSITEDLIAQLRKKYQAVLMADRGAIINTNIPTNLPKQRLNRRKLTRSKSIIQQILPNKEESEENDPKLKNVRQTEHLVDLKNAVYQICQYFISCDELLAKTATTQADYSLDQEEYDRHVFVNAQKAGFKRARALLDFQRQEEDELGFRKNDIILVIDEKDEHCWVGEVNGLRGWFPAKFVEIVDDRGKNYSVYGDEAINSEVTELIRGQLATAFKQIMEHGLRHYSLYSFALHPWLFIEEIAKSSVQCHFNAVNSRLTLCDTFKLDQDRKILTPEELLYRAVQEINESHSGSKALLDVKLRSLVVYAVNEQCLHLWVELMCKNPMQEQIRKQYYHSDSFIRSPAWMQIKCELRLLTQFSFSLDVDYEISSAEKAKKKCTNGQRRFMLSLGGGSRDGNTKRNVPTSKQPLKEGVRDMLIKHHLFSWDL